MRYLFLLVMSTVTWQGCLVTQRLGVSGTYVESSGEKGEELSLTMGLGDDNRNMGLSDTLLYTVTVSAGCSSNYNRTGADDKKGTFIGSYMGGVEYININQEQKSFRPDGFRVNLSSGMRKQSFYDNAFTIQGTVGIFKGIMGSDHAVSLDLTTGWIFGD
ncbi:MAG: hypothetical protein JXR95_11400 [Deltaproteobacteria bacterium]|nr:hypothetical protein [Deltaproteobacteria bacterium]